MAKVLQLSQLVQHDRVPQMDVGRGWIEAKLAAQWLTGRPRPRQLLRKLGLTRSSSQPRFTSASASRFLSNR